MKSLGSIFGSVVGDTRIPPHIAGGVVTRVNIINEVRQITLWVHFRELVGHDDLMRTEKLYSRSLDSLVVIKPHFGRELFTTKYFPELYKAVKKEIPCINGTLNNAEVSMEGDTLTISLRNGGKAILDARNFERVITRIISEMFDMTVRLRYTGVLEVTENSREYRQTMQNAEKQIEREQLRKAAEFSGIRIEACAMMDNHVHVLCTVTRTGGKEPAEEVVRRVRVLRGDRAADALMDPLVSKILERVLKCCSARISVGAMNAHCEPFFTAV